MGEKPTSDLPGIAPVAQTFALGFLDGVPQHLGGGGGVARHQKGKPVDRREVFTVGYGVGRIPHAESN